MNALCSSPGPLLLSKLRPANRQIGLRSDLICRNKKLVQDAVVGSSSATPADGASAQKNEVMSLLLGEDELEESLRQAELKRKKVRNVFAAFFDKFFFLTSSLLG